MDDLFLSRRALLGIALATPMLGLLSACGGGGEEEGGEGDEEGGGFGNQGEDEGGGDEGEE